MIYIHDTRLMCVQTFCIYTILMSVCARLFVCVCVCFIGVSMDQRVGPSGYTRNSPA